MVGGSCNIYLILHDRPAITSVLPLAPPSRTSVMLRELLSDSYGTSDNTNMNGHKNLKYKKDKVT